MFKDKNILKYYKRFALILAIGIMADILVDFVQLFIPQYLGEVVQIVGFSINPTYDDISNIVIKIIIVAIALFLGRIIMRFTILYASGKIQAGLRHDMFKKAERLSQRYYHQNKVGNIMSWFSSDLEAIEEFTGWGTIMIVDALFLSTMAIIKMWQLDFILTLIAMIPMLALIIWGFLVEKTMSDKWDQRQSQFDRLYDFTQENFTGIRVIKAFVKENKEILAFSKIAKDNADKNLDFAKTSIRFDICIELIIGLIISIVMGVGAFFVYCYVGGHPTVLFGHTISLTAGGLTSFVGYSEILIWPMIAMGQIVQMYSRASASLKRVSHFLDEDEEIHNNEDAIVLDNCKGNIRFDDFSFSYPDSKAHSLNNISLEIKSGEMIGVVGKIGSGKTTLVNSLLRLYNVEKGKIFIDDIDIMDLNIANLRDNIAYVPQDNFLFSDNIFNNIAFSNNKMSMNEVRTAAKFAAVDDNIIGFSQGYETLTGERGVTLSGGQKQRISIARAYAKDAPIMILDDAVSAVDVNTEETILANIAEKRKGKTTIIIASRVSTVAHLDKILVLNNGNLEAFDTPERLLEISPTYKKMVFLQQLEAEL
ncbi:MAG: ABC transporter ATP-binding protein [Erysipelotrichaceae bacterium]|nr:ABC transporter ATP-binding protein [Erysipelotrichaceae bacterium]